MAIVAVAFVGTSFLALLALILRNRWQRLHRVDPAVPTDAPMSWVADPRLPARLHRRLARVGTAAGAVIDDHTPRGRRGRRAEPSPIAAAAAELRDRAVAIDRQVARLAVLAPAARRPALAQLAAAVAEAESAAARLTGLSGDLLAPRRLGGDDPAMADLTRRLDHLADAHRELDDLDRAAGLHADRLPGPSAAAAPTVVDEVARALAAEADATRPDPAAVDPTRPDPTPLTWPPSAPGSRR